MLAIIIKLVLFLLYTVIMFDLGRRYQVIKTLNYVEKELRKRVVDQEVKDE